MNDVPNETPSPSSAPGRSIADPVAMRLDSAGRVSDPEAICLQCGYTIHRLPGTGSCPECGRPVADSLQGRLLRFSDRTYVQTLHRGVLCLLVGLVLAFAGQLVGGLTGLGVGLVTAVNAVRTAAVPAPAPAITVTPPGSGETGPTGAVTAPPVDAAPALPAPVPADPAVPGDTADAEAEAATPPAPSAPREQSIVRPEIDTASSPPPGPSPPAGAATTSSPPAPNVNVTVSGGAGGVTITGGGGPAALPRFARRLVVFISSVGAAFELLVLLGWWWFSSPDPVLPAGERGDGPRRVIRTFVVLVAIGTFVGLALTHSGLTGFRPRPGFLGMVGVAAFTELSKVARSFAGMLYLRWLAPRLPDEVVDRRSRLYIWLLPVIYVVGSCVGVGPIVAAVMQWILLLRVRNDLKQILDDMPVPIDSGGVAPAALR
jgi:hypothetical protein